MNHTFTVEFSNDENMSRAIGVFEMLGDVEYAVIDTAMLEVDITTTESRYFLLMAILAEFNVI